MKNYEVTYLLESHWALGFWLMPQWFGIQIANFKLVVTKKCEKIESLNWENDPLFADYNKELDEWRELFWGKVERR